MRFMGLAFAQKPHGGPVFGHILRKFTGLKEGVGENFPNTGWVIVSARPGFALGYIFLSPSLSPFEIFFRHFLEV